MTNYSDGDAPDRWSDEAERLADSPHAPSINSALRNAHWKGHQEGVKSTKVDGPVEMQREVIDPGSATTPWKVGPLRPVPVTCPDCVREAPLLCEAHTTVTPMVRHGQSAEWWAGVTAFADVIGSTIDEDGDDVDQASSNIAGLLDAAGRKDSPETWKQFAYKTSEDREECPRCGYTEEDKALHGDHRLCPEDPNYRGSR